jgi:prepilin-type N-terminal cleavage/methylation domain-containing protein
MRPERSTKRSPERSPQRGFTLLETLLALVIGGLVLTAAYTAVVRAAAARDGATRRTGEVARARLALLEMARTIESASPQPFNANAAELRIAVAEPEPRLVRYALDDSRLVEDRTIPFATGGAAPTLPGSSRVLLDGVQAFSVRCFGDGAWADGWRGTDAPRAVELTIRVADGEELRTRIVLPLSGAS